MLPAAAETGVEAEPGFWRRIELHPSPTALIAGIEDDAHRFLIHLNLQDGIVAGVEVKGERIPYTTCADAGGFFKDSLVGLPLREIANLDSHSHCTHVFDLAVLCARHASDATSTRFDLRVTDLENGQRRATLYENGERMLRWEVTDTFILGPGVFNGQDLRKFSIWKDVLSPTELEHASMLRRAVMVSGSRAIPINDATRPADRGQGRMGACFTYQMPRVLQAERAAAEWRKDFSHSHGPLQDFTFETSHPGSET
jgi:hypothetical protein